MIVRATLKRLQSTVVLVAIVKIAVLRTIKKRRTYLISTLVNNGGGRNSQ